MRWNPRKVGAASLFLLWTAAVGLGIHMAMKWDSKVGLATTAAPKLNQTSKELRLILIAHAECPCTKASLQNLRGLGDDSLARLHVLVVLTGPNAFPGSSAENVRLAQELPHGSLEYCSAKQEMERYGGQTSGQCFLYAPGGKLLFRGGITAGRGVEGDSAGMEAIRAALNHVKGPESAPVFGCQIATPTERQYERPSDR